MNLITTIQTLATVLTLALTTFAHAKTDQVPGVSEQPDSYFYTGKPYDADLGSYVFAYRNYDASINRWTTADPSGFSDGANNHLYIGNSATFSVDYAGLLKKVLWLYAWKGNGLDNDSYNQFQAAYQEKYSALVELDKNGNNHYVDDRDWFDFNSFTSLAQLASFSQYDKIFVAAHGWIDSSPPEVQGTYRIGGSGQYGDRYTEAQIKAASSKVVKVLGCAGETTNAYDVADSFYGPTKTYLRE